MNPQPPRTVREVIKVVTTPSGESIAAVVCSDGSHGITRDGVMLSSVHWPSNEREQCLAFLDHFARTTGAREAGSDGAAS
jgi:hypothetical protein